MIPRLAAVAVRLPLTFEVGGGGTGAPATTAATTTTTTSTTTTTTTTLTVPEFTSGDETVQLTIYTSNLLSGKHTLYIQATDSDGYTGAVASTFIEVYQRKLRGGGSFPLTGNGIENRSVLYVVLLDNNNV